MPVVDINYVRRDSVVHRLHPFTVIAFELSVFITATVLSSPLHLLGLILLTFVVTRVAKLPLRHFRYMKFVFFILVFFIFTQGIWFTSFGDYGEVAGDWRTLFNLWPSWLPGGPRIPFVLEGVIYGLGLGLRFVAIAYAFPILVMTVHPRDLVTALAGVRIWGRRMPYNLIFVLANGLRYIPTISKRFDETIDAQRARGVQFETRRKRVRAIGPLLLPVIINSLVSAQDLTLALETRAFGAPGERTFYRQVRFRHADVFVTGSLIVFMALLLLLRTRFGFGLLEIE